MTTRFLVDPQLLPMLDQFPPLAFTRESLPEVRKGMAEMQQQMAATLPPVPGVKVSERRVPGPTGGPAVRVLVYESENERHSRAGLLWIHGGGFVMGNADADDLNCRAMAAEIGCVIVSVDYRLSPETPFPGPVEDCYAALRWLHQDAASLGVDQARLAVGGMSAGGNLAAAVALLARDRKAIPLVFQLLIYPMLDDRTVSHPEPHPYTGEYIWTPECNRFGWSSMLGDALGSDTVSSYAAPAREKDLRGLPPTYISAGALDLFLEEDMEYARRLTRASVPTELHVYPGGYHAFDGIAPEADVSRAFRRDIMSALQKALGTR